MIVLNPEQLSLVEIDYIRKATQLLRKDIVALKAAKALEAAPLDPHRMYGPKEIAAYLGISYDTAARRMKDMSGVVNLGTKEKMHKRGKAKLRISGKHLTAYLRNKSLE